MKNNFKKKISLALLCGLTSFAALQTTQADEIGVNALAVDSFTAAFDGNSSADLGLIGSLGQHDFVISFIYKTSIKANGQAIIGNRNNGCSGAGGQWFDISITNTGTTVGAEITDNGNYYNLQVPSTTSLKLTDGNYHRVSFTRKGSTLSLKLDELAPVTTTIIGILDVTNLNDHVKVGTGDCLKINHPASNQQKFNGVIRNLVVAKL